MCCRVRREMSVKGEQPVAVGSGYCHRPTVVGAIGGGVATVYFTIFVVKILLNFNRARAARARLEARLVTLAEFEFDSNSARLLTR
jgi:hypothetical protein